MHWQPDAKESSLALLGFDFDFAAMVLDDALADRKSQSHAGFFSGRKKRLKYFLQVIRGDAMAGIRHADDNLFSGLTGAVERRADRELAAADHGVEGVEIKVHQDLFQLLRIRVNGRQIRSDRLSQCDFLLVQP